MKRETPKFWIVGKLLKGKHFTSTRDDKCYWIIRRIFQYYFVPIPKKKSNLKAPTTIADANLRYVCTYTQIFSLPFSLSKRTNNAMQFRGKKIVKRISNISGAVPRGRFFIGTSFIGFANTIENWWYLWLYQNLTQASI